MRPANLSRSGALLGRGRGKSFAQTAERSRRSVADALATRAPADRAHLALDASAVLLDRALDARAALAQLALEARAAPAHLALEPVAGGGAPALVALELALEARAGAVPGGDALDASRRGCRGPGGSRRPARARRARRSPGPARPKSSAASRWSLTRRGAWPRSSAWQWPFAGCGLTGPGSACCWWLPCRVAAP